MVSNNMNCRRSSFVSHVAKFAELPLEDGAATANDRISARRLRAPVASCLVGCAAVLMSCSFASATIIATFNPDLTNSLTVGLAGTSNPNIEGYAGNDADVEDRTLLHFDISSIASKLTSGYSVAALTLTVNSSASSIVNGDTLTPTIYPISNANAGWAATLNSSWNNLDQTVPTAWAGGPGLGAPGGPGIGSALASLSFSTTPVGPETFTFTGNLTGLLDGWLTTNAGLIVLDPFTASGGTNSSDPTVTPGSYFEFDRTTAITLTATLALPEPATGVMFCAGVAALGVVALKRRRF